MSSLPYCNGLKIKGLNQDAGNVAVQSSSETTWMLVRRKWKFMPAQWMEKAVAPNEIVHIKAQDGTACAELEIMPMGDAAATIVCQSNRAGNRTLRVGSSYTFAMKPGEALVFYNPQIRHPYQSEGAGFLG